MINIDDSIIELKKYIKKLIYIVNNESKLTLFNKKIIDKVKLDDILCCIEGCFPDEYKAWLRKHGKNSLQSYQLYQRLIAFIRNKTIFGSSNYSVYYKEVLQIVTKLPSAIFSDMHIILNNEQNMS